MIKKSILALFLLFFVGTVGSFYFANSASAIPPFAEKYHFACNVCHTTFPNLNPFGRAFWRNGFRLPNTNGTPADATQIAQGISLPNPWPVPMSIGMTISYQHTTNENVSASTDPFGIMGMIDWGGSFKLYSPLANSLSFFLMNNSMPMAGKGFFIAQDWASLNGFASGLGLPSHLVNLAAGQPDTAAPYFDRQFTFMLAPIGPVANVQGLNVGYDGEAGVLAGGEAGGGFELFGTPGYNLWYRFSVTNDGGSGVGTASGGGDSVSNAMVYTYQLKEYMPISVGQLEIGYYGATVAEPLTETGQGSWTNRVTVNGVDLDLANDVYELGATYMVQGDNHPYGNPSLAATNLTIDGSVVGNTNGSNGYSTFELYGRYTFPTLAFGNALMLSAEYAQYSWTHKDLQEAYQNSNPTSCENAGLYQSGTYSENGCTNEGIKDAFDVNAKISLAYNTNLYLEYVLTNKDQNDTFGAGLNFAF